MSVLSKLYAAVVVGLLHDEQEPLEWTGLRGRREGGHWEWQEDRRDAMGARVLQV